LRLSDWRVTVARAPASDPSPAQWRKWNGKSWTLAGTNSDGAPLQKSIGVNAAFWPANNLVLLLESASSLHLATSRDKINFERVKQPMIKFDASEWNRPAGSDLYAYPTLTGENGLSDVTDKAILSYTYVPPGADFTKRHLVMHDVRLSMTPKPRPGVSLSRWSRDGRSWTTAGPPIEEGRPGYAFDKHLGYVMTSTPDAPSVEIEECMRQTADGPLYTLAKAGTCAARGAERRRAAGFLLESEEPSSAPLYECRAARESFIYSNRPDCEGLGDRPALLGFLLSR
jgi:hypothetical protein